MYIFKRRILCSSSLALPDTLESLANSLASLYERMRCSFSVVEPKERQEILQHYTSICDRLLQLASPEEIHRTPVMTLASLVGSVGYLNAARPHKGAKGFLALALNDLSIRIEDVPRGLHAANALLAMSSVGKEAVGGDLMYSLLRKTDPSSLSPGAVSRVFEAMARASLYDQGLCLGLAQRAMDLAAVMSDTEGARVVGSMQRLRIFHEATAAIAMSLASRLEPVSTGTLTFVMTQCVPHQSLVSHDLLLALLRRSLSLAPAMTACDIVNVLSSLAARDVQELRFKGDHTRFDVLNEALSICDTELLRVMSEITECDLLRLIKAFVDLGIGERKVMTLIEDRIRALKAPSPEYCAQLLTLLPRLENRLVDLLSDDEEDQPFAPGHSLMREIIAKIDVKPLLKNPRRHAKTVLILRRAFCETPSLAVDAPRLWDVIRNAKVKNPDRVRQLPRSDLRRTKHEKHVPLGRVRPRRGFGSQYLPTMKPRIERNLRHLRIRT